MKKAKILTYVILLALVWGCSEDDTSTSTETNSTATVDFTYTNDGSTFTFTNLSQGASTYRWDFGDLYFYSDTENPVYTYAIGGELIVTLTGIDDSGAEASVSKTITAPEIILIDIAIDGDFEDWDDVEVAYDESASGSGSIQKIKVWGAGENINIYLEGNASMKMELVDMFINTDEDITTGFLHWQWPESAGAEFLFEGPMINGSWGGFYSHNEPDGDWGWDWIADATNIDISPLITIDDDVNAIEFSIAKSQLGQVGSTIGFAVTELTEGWAEVANFPEGDSFIMLELQ